MRFAVVEWLMIWSAVLAPFGAACANTWVNGWGNLLGVAVSPTGDLAAAAGADGTVVLFSPKSKGWEVSRTLYSTSPPISLLFSPHGDVLYVIHDDGSLRLWDPHSGSLINSIAVFKKDSGSGGLALSPGGKFIAVGSLGAGVKVVQLSTGQVIYSLETSGIAVTFVSEDELAIGSEDGGVYL